MLKVVGNKVNAKQGRKMKTPEEIICTCTVGGYAEHGEYLYDVGEIQDDKRRLANLLGMLFCYLKMR